MMKKYINFIRKLNLKTIYFNFSYLPFRQAVFLPFFISKHVYLRKVDGQIKIASPLSPGLIQIGYKNVGIFDHIVSRSVWEVSGKVTFSGKTNIGHGTKISVGPNGELIMGKNFIISAESTLVAFSKIQFGDDCLLSWDILIMDTDFHKIMDLEGKVINRDRAIIIGDKVWIGCRSLILKGTNIPDKCIIGADSTVSGNLQHESCLYVGKPAKLTKENIRWEH